MSNFNSHAISPQQSPNRNSQSLLKIYFWYLRVPVPIPTRAVRGRRDDGRLRTSTSCSYGAPPRRSRHLEAQNYRDVDGEPTKNDRSDRQTLVSLLRGRDRGRVPGAEESRQENAGRSRGRR